MNSLTLDPMWFKYWMPYVLQKIEHPGHKHVWLPLNRKYKLLGQRSDAWVDYAAHADKAMMFESDPLKFKEIWHVCRPDMLALYDDSPESRTTYFNRLGALVKKAKVITDSPMHPRALSGRLLTAGSV